MALTKVYDAPIAWKYLNGLINVYKPAGKKVLDVRNSLLFNLCKDLNEMKVREPRKMLSIEPGGPHGHITRKITDISDDILAVGQRYQIIDFKCNVAANLGRHTSGVLLVGINRGTALTRKIHETRPIRIYHITGRFGSSTETNFYDSRITSRATYRHIYPDRLSSMIASLQASHQRKMYEMCGVDLQSQAAYEIACKGLIRPLERQQPVIYGINVIDFKRPEFTLEIHAINETEMYLAALLNDIGIEMKSVAHCTAIRCIRHGDFTLDNTLLRRYWTLQGVFDNMNICRTVLNEHPLEQKHTELIENNIIENKTVE